MERIHTAKVQDREKEQNTLLRRMIGTQSSRTPARRASAFVIESLEARVLLSGELATAIQAPVAIAEGTVAATAFLLTSSSTPSAPAQTMAGTSPHLASLQVADFGRAYNENESGGAWSPSRTESAVQWYAERVDITEQQTVLTRLRQYNPTMKSWVYALDLYQYQHEVGTLPESSFLHVSEPTSVTLRDISGKVMAEQTIPTGGRLEVGVWLNKHWPFNLKDPALRAYNSERILNLIGAEAGVFLDAHGPTFSDAFKVGPLTTINYGGGIQEYGGRRPGDPTLEAEYNADVVNWLGELQQKLAAAGKWGVVNVGTDFAYSQNARDQALAMSGFETEGLITPNALRGAHSVQQLYDLTQQVTANGGTVILSGLWGTIPADYTAGNYGSGEARQDMWRLAFYYIVKQPAGSPGVTYFDLNLQSYATHNVPADQAEWHAAYQHDIGHPTGGMTVAQTGISPSDGAPYTVFTRPYSGAQVLFRPMDQWSSIDYGDRSAVSVSLSGNYRQLREDGTTGPLVNAVQIRNGEALILLPESGVVLDNVVVAPTTPVQPTPAPAPAPAPVIATPVPVPNPTPTPLQPAPVPSGNFPSTTSGAWTVADLLAFSFVPATPAPVVTPTPEPAPAPVPPAPVTPPASFSVADMLAMDWTRPSNS
jgi:hypothetical protein